MSVEAVAPSNAAVTGAIRSAANATGASFDYLLATAKVESSLNPNLTTRSSSATGLFQFVEQTWLATLKQAGPALGYGDYAAAIAKTPSGRYGVADLALRREIMALRKNPTVNAVMAGAFTQQNAGELARRIGRAPTEGELYVAHFFGPQAGAKAINLAADNPTAKADDIFPAAARANGPIFYDGQGRARSIAGVCAELMRRYQAARNSSSASQVAVAQRPPAAVPIAGAEELTAAAAAAPPAPSRISPTAMAFAGDPAPERPAGTATPSSAAPTLARAERVGYAFHSLFQTVDRRDGVSPVVTRLWGSATRETGGQAMPGAASSSAPPVEPVESGGRPALDLFRDQPASVRALFDHKA